MYPIHHITDIPSHEISKSDSFRDPQRFKLPHSIILHSVLQRFFLQNERYSSVEMWPTLEN